MVAGSNANYLFGYDAVTGARRWRYSLIGPPWTALSADDSLAYAVIGAGIIAAVDVRTGQVRWTIQPSRGGSVDGLFVEPGVDASVVW